MRKYIQKQIIEIIGTLSEAVQFIKNDKMPIINHIGIIEDCEITIEHIKTTLLSNFNEDCFTKYQDCLKNLSQGFMDIKNTVVSEKSKYIQNIKKNLYDLTKLLKNEKDVTFEIVFLPYKASMFDCMESVWRSANDDPYCNANVIPIPFYEKKAETNTMEYHYEGDLFPSDIPIIDYKLYDMEKHHPDIVYFHNPFNENNYVSSVEPRFFSYEVKKHTDMLVYIPYFFTGGGMPNTHLSHQSYNDADYIVVQSKNEVKQMSDYVSSKKLLALGSPKVDKILSCLEKRDIPEQWKSIIQGKKVIMLNTSINSMLADTPGVLKKMMYIFDVFKSDGRVVLLWRPHPLLKATLASLRNEYLESYEGIEKYFIMNNVGIYDATPNIESTVAICDAYIGEASSSVVHMFGVAGKPIYITNHFITETPTLFDKESLQFYYIADSDKPDIKWVITSNNLLCRLDLNDYTFKIIDSIDNPNRFMFYQRLIQVDNKLYIQPGYGNEICIYEIDTGFKKYIELKAMNLFGGPKFINIFRYDDFVYMMPCSYPAVVKINIKTNSICYDQNCCDSFLHNDNYSQIFYSCTDVNNDKVYISSAKSNKIMIYHLENDSFEVHNVGKNDNTYSGIVDFGDCCYLCEKKSFGLIKWDISTNGIQEFKQLPPDFQINRQHVPQHMLPNIVFSGFAKPVGTNILILPLLGNMIIKFDTVTNIFTKVDIPLHYKEGERKSSYYGNVYNYTAFKVLDESSALAVSAYDNSIVEINLDNDTAETYSCQADLNSITEYINEETRAFHTEGFPYIFAESQYFTLDDFIKYITSGDFNREAQITAYSSVIEYIKGGSGESIHEKIKSIVLNEN